MKAKSWLRTTCTLYELLTVDVIQFFSSPSDLTPLSELSYIFWTYLNFLTDTSSNVKMRLDDQQRSVRCPSDKTKNNIDAQEESVISVIIGQAFQCETNQLLAKGDLRRKEDVTCHMVRIRKPKF